MKVIGLFGTCGNSTWRKKFISEYEKKGIQYFNPQKEDWCPEDADTEAYHLTQDEILLFPVTDETYGCGSLAEIGFAVMRAMTSNQILVVFVDYKVSEELTDVIAKKESLRTRDLVRSHLAKVSHPNVKVVNSLDEMLETSIKMYVN